MGGTDSEKEDFDYAFYDFIGNRIDFGLPQRLCGNPNWELCNEGIEKIGEIIGSQLPPGKKDLMRILDEAYTERECLMQNAIYMLAFYNGIEIVDIAKNPTRFQSFISPNHGTPHRVTFDNYLQRARALAGKEDANG